MATFASELRRLGCAVRVVAPEFDDQPADETDVVRIPAIQRFNGSDFSVRLPIPGLLDETIEAFDPQVVHSHHPFLLGDTALRIAAARGLPLVFTHHTMYEQYTHYVPLDSPAMKRFVAKLAVGYCGLCDRIVAPSRSVADILRRRGVRRPIEEIPTGVDVAKFGSADGAALRRELGIPATAPVVGHLGRLAPEKNLAFLGEAIGAYLWRDEGAYALVAGDGPSRAALRDYFEREGLADRVRLPGTLVGDALLRAYAAMDVFAFASKSETQGMVLAEAMASGKPVVALDAPGAREIVRDGVNGRLLKRDGVFAFATAIAGLTAAPAEERAKFREGALATAREFSQEVCAAKLLALYEDVLRAPPLHAASPDDYPWSGALRLVQAEWDRIQAFAGATRAALAEGESESAEGTV